MEQPSRHADTATEEAECAPASRDDAVARYLDVLLPAPDALALAMRNVAVAEDMPIAPAATGALLQLLTRLHRPAHVLEVGTGIGFLTLLIARELGVGTTITSIERDPIRQSQAHAFLERDPLRCAIELRLGEARDVLCEAAYDVDMLVLGGRTAGLDQELLEDMLDVVVPGGLVVVCGVLQGGAVAPGIHPGEWGEPEVEQRRSFNRRFVLDDRLDRPMLLPVGDGVAVATMAR